jgi:predicted dienelactone hydrolase
MLHRILLLPALWAAFAAIPLPAAAAEIRYERSVIEAASGEPMEIGIWSPPEDGMRLPLVIISHGTGGDFRGHIDTAEALARAGFVVAAVTHPGDNWRDNSQAFAVWRRPRHLSLALDYLLGQWPGRRRVDPNRIGAFGFSAGGFTVLVAAGGVPDLSRLAGHCRANPRFFDCGIATNAPLQFARFISWSRDVRLRAIAVAAPALGFTFEPHGLRRVTLPVQLWRAEQDQVLPHPFYAEPVRRSLPRAPEYRVVPQGRHFDFLSPCGREAAALRPQFCSSAPGFDRAAFHVRMNDELIRFFGRHLGSASQRGRRREAQR